MQILLKKSDFIGDQNFAEALMRSTENYVEDRVTNQISNGRPYQGLYEALDRKNIGFDESQQNSVAI